MLNLVAFDKEDDSQLLESSYEAIRNRDSLQIINDNAEKGIVYKKMISSLTLPINAIVAFQNLFKLTLSNGQFYIAQCLFDFGYPVSMRLVQSSVQKYSFYLVGIADLKINLGKTLLRRETKIDKIVGHFFSNDIDFEGAEEFNEKYYLVSNKKDTVHQTFNKRFIDTLSKYNDIVLLIKEKQMFITFENEMNTSHSRAVEDIFSNCNFLVA